MARYIDAEVMPKDEFWDDLSDREKAKVLQYLIGMPTADVVPREVVEKIFEEIVKEYELDGMTYLDEILCGHLMKFLSELREKYDV